MHGPATTLLQSVWSMALSAMTVQCEQLIYLLGFTKPADLHVHVDVHVRPVSDLIKINLVAIF